MAKNLFAMMGRYRFVAVLGLALAVVSKVLLNSDGADMEWERILYM
jgi:hypothetical protein